MCVPNYILRVCSIYIYSKSMIWRFLITGICSRVPGFAVEAVCQGLCHGSLCQGVELSSPGDIALQRQVYHNSVRLNVSLTMRSLTLRVTRWR